MNKKGVDIIAVYWFSILIIVAVGISAMVFMYYRHPYDVRELEANILVNKVADCISEHGKFNEKFTDSEGNFVENFDILKECRLIFDAGGSSGEYYTEIDINGIGNQKKKSYYAGNNALKPQCDFEGEGKEKLSVCSNGNLYVINEKGESFSVDILAIVKKTNENVKI